METKNELLRAAQANRQRKEAETQKQRQDDERVEAAYAELDHRDYLLSFPDADLTQDSHARVKEDRDALQEFLAEPGVWEKDDMREDSPKTTDELLAEIRDQLSSSE